MAHIAADRVQETFTTTGTGAITTTGAVAGFRTFGSVMATNDTCFYAIGTPNSTEWETGLGTYSSANTITRTTVFASSNAGAAVNFSAGIKLIFMSPPASKAVVADNNGLVTANSFASSSAAITGGSIDGTPIGATTASSGKFTTLSATGALTYGGVTLSAAVTGTGNMVLSASPTFTGTVNGAAATWTGNATAAAFIPSSSTIPTNGLYLVSGNVLGWGINSAAMMSLDASGLTIGPSTQRTAKLYVGVAQDTTPTTISGWDTRHAVIGSNVTGLAVSCDTSSGGTSYITTMTPGVSWGALVFQGSSWSFKSQGLTQLCGIDTTGVTWSAGSPGKLWVSGGVSIGNTTDPGAGALSVTGKVVATTTIKTGSYTAATLPSASGSGAGASAFVTDATSTTFLSTVAGGGSNKVPVTSDGTNWLIG